MNWKDIKTSTDNKYFLVNGKPIFDKHFTEVLKFHEPGLAPVKDETGSYHIDILGNELYKERYSRTFGFYCNRAAVIDNNCWFHIDEFGKRSYSNSYEWTGNFQENLCTVRDKGNNYFYINLNGERLNHENYLYCGDFKDGIACVKTKNGFFKHINNHGKFINDNEYYDLGIFHKGFATAKDEKGWFHIDLNGEELYSNRYLIVEPFYNGFALVTTHDNQKLIIDENGDSILKI